MADDTEEKVVGAFDPETKSIFIAESDTEDSDDE